MKRITPLADHHNLGVWTVLGLTGRGSEEWSRLQGFQYAQLVRVCRARLLAQALAASVTLLLFAPIVGHGALAGWLGALCGSLSFSVRSDWQLADTDRRRMTEEEFRRQTLGTVINALAWCVPLVLFLPQAPIHLRFELWTVLAMLMTVSAVIVPTVPLATLVFSSIVGAGAIATFWMLGQPGMAGVAALFVLCIAMGTIEASRHFLAARLASAGMAERNEVVSLLLREFDQEDADWLWEIDAQRRVRGASPRFAEALGRPLAEVEGENLMQLLVGSRVSGTRAAADPGLQALAQRLQARESFSNLLVRITVLGERRYWSLSGAPRQDDQGRHAGFRGVASDITEQQESSEKIAYLARYDTLTGLPNRMMITDAVHTALEEARAEGQAPAAFLMLDLDRFKAVNDTLGHPVGDQLLEQVAERLQSLMPPQALCGRLGGDEFCVVLRQVEDPQAIASLAQAIIAHLSEPYFIERQEVLIGASVGSAMGPRDGDSVEELMRHADFALYRAKRCGRGQHSAFDEALAAQADQRAATQKALCKAVEQEQFELFYQPVVDSHSERLVCLEALLRWNHPEQGLLTPDHFLELADESRLIVPIGAWVLAQACRQVAQWPGKLRVAVNISDRQILDPAFIDHVVAALATSGLAPQRLEIEVTEAVFAREPATARATLERLLALGCAVTLDDFGHGQASLSFLCELRFSAIKLDRALIKGAAMGNAESIAMIRAVVALADSLEITTIAKGVETQAELEAASLLGCRRMQGRAYGEAMSQIALAQLFGAKQKAQA